MPTQNNSMLHNFVYYVKSTLHTPQGMPTQPCITVMLHQFVKMPQTSETVCLWDPIGLKLQHAMYAWTVKLNKRMNAMATLY